MIINPFSFYKFFGLFYFYYGTKINESQVKISYSNRSEITSCEWIKINSIKKILFDVVVVEIVGRFL